MRVALTGLPGAGKSALFDFVAEGKGIPDDRGGRRANVLIPDARLRQLSDIFRPKKTTYAQVEWWDGPWGGVKREGDKGDPWEPLRASDFLLYTVRDFETGNYDYPRPAADSEADGKTLASELVLADLAMLERRAEKLRDSVKKPTPQQEAQRKELELAEKMKAFLEQGKLLSEYPLTEGERRLFRGFRFLSEKLCRTVVVRGEGGGTVREGQFLVHPVLEKELAELSPEEAAEFRREWQLPEGSRVGFVRQVLRAAGWSTFFTVGEDEVRAWLIPDHCPAAQSAGVIHSDFERGFIRAEVISFDDFIAAGAMRKGGKDGKVRLEGKEYPVKDGDIIEFRFNV